MTDWQHAVRRQGARSLRAARLLRPRVSVVVSDEVGLASARRVDAPIEIVSSDPGARDEDWRVHAGEPRGQYVVRLGPGDKVASGLLAAAALDADLVFHPQGSLARPGVTLENATSVAMAPAPIVKPGEPLPRTGVFGAMYDSRPRLAPFFAQRPPADPDRLKLWQQAAWHSDVRWFVQDAERLDADQWAQVRDWVRAATLPELPVEQRARVWLTRQDDKAGLEKLVADLRPEQGDFPTELIDGRAYAVLPVPDDVRALTEEETALVLAPHSVRGGVVELFAYVKGVDTTQAVPTVTVNGVTAEVQSSREVTRHAGTRHVNHDLGLVRVSDGRLLEVTVEVAGYTRTGTLVVEPREPRVPSGVDSPLADDERGPYCQARLQEAYAASTELVDQIYFQSYPGRTPTDSPAAIHAELVRRGVDLPMVWGVADESVVTPPGVGRAIWRSRAWYDALARSRYIVTNIEMESWFRRKDGQQLLQTFHGYPSKSMGLDLWRAKEWTPSRIEAQLDRTSRNWSLLLTPAPEMNRHYREQYDYHGPILSKGYPRDDVLLSEQALSIRHEARERLGIRPAQTAVLYAPTWRDDQATNFRAAKAVHYLDVERAARALGPDYVLLLRGHRFTASAATRRKGAALARAGIVDVTDHPEVNDLILAADAAVLDYSSLRFDFALTGKPMVFLVPDLASYSGPTRGFLYPFEPTAPGPLLEDTDQVVEALRRLPELGLEYVAEYVAFNERYNAFQDGHASERTVSTFFGLS